MKTHRVTIGKKSKELICFSKVVIMLEMLRNLGEPALLALDIYQEVKFDAFGTSKHGEGKSLSKKNLLCLSFF